MSLRNTTTSSSGRGLSLPVYACLSKEVFLRIQPAYLSYLINQNDLMCLRLNKKQEGWLLERQPTNDLLCCLFSNIQKKIYGAPIKGSGFGGTDIIA